jgi:hypothetical protein
MFRALLRSSSWGQICISTASDVVPLEISEWCILLKVQFAVLFKVAKIHIKPY